jgi:hypothetical protein
LLETDFSRHVVVIVMSDMGSVNTVWVNVCSFAISCHFHFAFTHKVAHLPDSEPFEPIEDKSLENLNIFQT